MVKLQSALLAFFVLALTSSVLAHDFWAGTKGPSPEGKVTVFLGFGHNFPAGEDISPENVAARYEPIRLVGPKSEVALSAAPEPRAMLTAEALTDGSYLVVVQTKVGFSGRGPAGWVRKSKREDPSLTSCSYGGSFGKAVLNIGGVVDSKAVGREVGHLLEIVPQVNPAQVRVGQSFPVKVIYNGKPLAGASVNAYFAGFTENNSAFAFSGSTDKEGTANIIPLRPGDWLAKVNVSQPYSEPDACDRESYTATLVFNISE